MNVDQVLNLIANTVGELSPEQRSVIEMALYELFHRAWDEGYGEAEYLRNC